MSRWLFGIALALTLSMAAGKQSEAGGSYIDGDTLVEKCAAGDASAGQFFCVGFITGVVDSIGALDESGVLPNNPICMTSDPPVGELFAVTRTYLDKHPEQRHSSATILVMMALKDAFPC